MAAKVARYTIIFVPFPAQGHVTPMLRLARTLVDHGDVSVTVAVPDFIHCRMAQLSILGVALVSIPSSIQDDGNGEPPGPPSFLHAIEHYMPAQLEGMLTTERGIVGARRVSCLVVDLLASWAIPVAARLGLPVVGFWVGMLATYRTVAVIPELMDKGLISESVNRAKNIRSILVNSINGEGGDSELYDPPQGQEILPVGPLLFNHDSKKTTAMWQVDQTCIGWLDKQSVGSVIYVSFGSWAAPMEPEKITGFAHGLEASGRPFLWVLKNHPSWRAGLPDRYMEKVACHGKIVSWAPQDDILKHKAVGCYITHCGWNSVLEAVRHGVRMICFPISSDHFINCAYIVHMWEVGIALDSSDQSNVKDCIGRVMEGEKGRHLQQMVNKLRKTITVGEAMCVAKRSLSLFMERIKNNLSDEDIRRNQVTPQNCG
ncbi:UDP-glycosyltransferase 82A1-like [Panicum miliaceum]|uniref:Glycosyltransferase n=1 Tax=Panicum miliaceum TaxID=4540 RepID=A0A3L6QL94_PANMI|nr:UDP-glycosyltransferase 82A1-like [Panicum miliaceum]